MVGLGAANLAAGFFQGFPISSSSSRTPVAEAAGARTQLTSVVGALAIAFLLLVAPNLLQHLPTAALAAVVIAAAIGLIRGHRPQTDLPHSAVGVLAVDRLLCRRGGARRDSGNRPRNRHRHRRVSMGRLAPALGRTRPRPMASRVITTSRDIRMHGRSPVWSCFGGMRRCSSPTRNSSRSAFWTPWRNRRRRCAGWSLRRSRSPAWTSLPAIHLPNWTRRCTQWHRALLCRTQGPGKGQAEEIWIVRATWREYFFPTIGAAVSSYLEIHDVERAGWED